ncbi:LOW QUALITY PROTEIN: hypothetical protein CRUP_014353, partial [Coryphaenoides rupestris]
ADEPRDAVAVLDGHLVVVVLAVGNVAQRAARLAVHLGLGVVQQRHQHGDALQLPHVLLDFVVLVAQVLQAAALDLTGSMGWPSMAMTSGRSGSRHRGSLRMLSTDGERRPAMRSRLARLPRSGWASGAEYMPWRYGWRPSSISSPSTAASSGYPLGRERDRETDRG